MRRVALLRGVNVGGKAKVAMAQLKTVFEETGAKRVETYIQSGNVAFDGPTSLSAKKLETAIEKHFKLNVAVTVRTHAQLGKVIGDCPFDDTSSVHVAFLIGKPKVKSIDVSSFAPEDLAFHGDELYLYLPNGMGRTKLPPYVDRRIGVPMTVRNWRTVTTLHEMSRVGRAQK